MHRLFPVTLTGALLLGCTHDFDQFAPVAGGGAGTTSTTSGAGGATTTSGTGGATTTTTTGSGGQGTGGQGTGGAGGQTGTGGQGTGGALPDAGVEDCANGKDDDGDGKIDCADPKCDAGFTCAPTPAGWSGPGWLYDGATAGAPGCAGAAGDKKYEGYRDITAGPALCSQCSCGDATGTCELGALTAYPGAGCAAGGVGVNQGPANQCRDVNVDGTSFKAAAPVLKNATCQPNKVVISRPAPTWDTTGVVCGLVKSPAGGCGQDAVCAPRPVAPFGATLCVWKAGDAACPADFPEKHSFWDGATDARDCTPCECGAPTATCSATTRLYDKSCNQGELAVLPNDGSCADADKPGKMKVEVAVSGSCPASGGQATGTVTEGPSATTVCCAK